MNKCKTFKTDHLIKEICKFSNQIIIKLISKIYSHKIQYKKILTVSKMHTNLASNGYKRKTKTKKYQAN
jgi:hypothetical protein